MSGRSGTSSAGRCRKRKQPASVFPERLSLNNDASSVSNSDYLENSPTVFDLELDCHVRRRLSPHPADLAHSNGGICNEPRPKRKIGFSSRQFNMLSCSPGGEEHPICDTVQDGSLDSATDFPMDFNVQRDRRVRRRLPTHPSDLPQLDDASSQQLCKERNPSTQQTSKRVSRRFNDLSCSGLDEVEDAPLTSTIPVSSNGHRQLANPHAAAGTHQRTKRKARLPSQWLDALPCSCGGGPPTCNTMLCFMEE